MSSGWIEEANGALGVLQVQLFTLKGFPPSKMLAPAGRDGHGEGEGDGRRDLTAVKTGRAVAELQVWENM
jgi:hypothetical protein